MRSSEQATSPFQNARLEYIFSTRAIRERAKKIHDLAQAGETHFKLHPEKLAETARFVAQVTRDNYPRLDVPFHSRWSHFQVGGVDRLKELNAKLSHLTPEERMRAKLDLVIVSVLLDAGAGNEWKYREGNIARDFARSEGLAVASLHMFLEGLFSSDPSGAPFRVDAVGLAKLSRDNFARAFQVRPGNALMGFEGRFELLKALGRTLETSSQYFGKDARPSGLADWLRARAHEGALEATRLLTALQLGLGPIWPGRLELDGMNLGDVWAYAPLGKGEESFVPFHKLSQWLTYSIVDPLQESGLKVQGFEKLTALAEYRNGGLLLDMGVIELRDPTLAERAHEASSEPVVEWRALTVALCDELAPLVRAELGKNENEMPLGKVLEGGTWWAGRKIAAKLRPPAGPAPLRILSDGTVF
jgi:hypothetical protein